MMHDVIDVTSSLLIMRGTKQISYKVLWLSKDMVIFNMSLGFLYFCSFYLAFLAYIFNVT